MKAPDTFTTATWNMAGGTDRPPTLARLEGILEDLLDRGVTIASLQEAQAPGVVPMLKRHGLRVEFHRPQYALAWDPVAWHQLDGGGVDLADTLWARPGKAPNVETDAAWAILADTWGRSLAAMSYHTAPSVQKPNPPPRRLQSTREAAATWRRLATGAGLREGEPDLSHTTAVLFSGDDNVDERLAFRDRFAFMLKQATTLRQVQAPSATHRGGRRIDDYRVAALKPLDGRVLDGGGDHGIHLREWRWRRVR